MRSVFLALIALVFTTAAWAQGDYRVQPGDVLSVEVLQDNTLNRDVLVLPDGRFSFPYAGTLKAEGLTLSQIQEEIKSGIASNFAVGPTVFVSMRQVKPAAPLTSGVAATINVYFLGEFASPGLKPVKPGTTFLQALAQGGSFTNFAALKRIQLRRTDASGHQNVTTINYRALANGGALSRDIVLQDGDIILAPERRLFE
jgi:polysaccharide export outer membrane protein